LNFVRTLTFNDLSGFKNCDNQSNNVTISGLNKSQQTVFYNNISPSGLTEKIYKIKIGGKKNKGVSALIVMRKVL